VCDVLLHTRHSWSIYGKGQSHFSTFLEVINRAREIAALLEDNDAAKYTNRLLDTLVMSADQFSCRYPSVVTSGAGCTIMTSAQPLLLTDVSTDSTSGSS
jgi:hypothetical protein